MKYQTTSKNPISLLFNFALLSLGIILAPSFLSAHGKQHRKHSFDDYNYLKLIKNNGYLGYLDFMRPIELHFGKNIPGFDRKNLIPESRFPQSTIKDNGGLAIGISGFPPLMDDQTTSDSTSDGGGITIQTSTGDIEEDPRNALSPTMEILNFYDTIPAKGESSNSSLNFEVPNSNKPAIPILTGRAYYEKK